MDPPAWERNRLSLDPARPMSTNGYRIKIGQDLDTCSLLTRHDGNCPKAASVTFWSNRKYREGAFTPIYYCIVCSRRSCDPQKTFYGGSNRRVKDVWNRQIKLQEQARRPHAIALGMASWGDRPNQLIFQPSQQIFFQELPRRSRGRYRESPAQSGRQT